MASHTSVLSPPHMAVLKGDLDELKRCCAAELHERDASGNTTLITAVDSGHEDVVEFLMGLEPHIDVDAKGMTGNTALHRACRRGHAKLAHRLLQASANPDIPNDKSQYPLHVAAFYQNCACVEALLAFGANAAVTDRKGRTPAEDTKDASIAAMLRRPPGEG